MNRIHSLRVFAMLFALSLLVLPGCYPQPEHAPKTVPTVQVVKVVPRDVQLYEVARGKTMESDSVDIVARVEGFLQGIYFRDGDVLKQGAPLFLIEQDQYKSTLDSQTALLEVAKAQELLAKDNFERGEELIKDNTISQEEYETRLANYQKAAAETKEAAANVVSAKLQLDYTQIYAPMPGMISHRLVSVGNLVGQAGGRTKLATLRKMDPMYVYFDMTDVQFNGLLDLLDQHFNADKKAKPDEEKEKPQQEKKDAPAPPKTTTQAETESLLKNVVFQQPTDEKPATPTATAPATAPPKEADAPAPQPPTPNPDTKPQTPDPKPQTPTPTTDTNPQTPSPKPQAPNLDTNPQPQDTPPVVPFGSTKIGGTVPPVTELPKMEEAADTRRSPLLERARKMDRAIPFEIALPSAQVGGDLKYVFKGEIDYTDNTINPNAGKITIRGVISNPDYRIFPGQVVYVRIPHDVQKDAIVIREEAVLSDLSLKYILCVDEKNIVRKRIVELGTKPDATHVIVEKGLKAGETYIVRGLQKARIDQEVKPEELK